MTVATWPHDDLAHAWWVTPGAVLAGEYPTDSRRTTAKLDVLLDAGIRTFVDLTTPHDGLHGYEPMLDRMATERGLDARPQLVSVGLQRAVGWRGDAHEDVAAGAPHSTCNADREQRCKKMVLHHSSYGASQAGRRSSASMLTTGRLALSAAMLE